jgi:hypothetical protein
MNPVRGPASNGVEADKIKIKTPMDRINKIQTKEPELFSVFASV